MSFGGMRFRASASIPKWLICACLLVSPLLITSIRPHKGVADTSVSPNSLIDKVDFDSLYLGLKRGAVYSNEVPRGRVTRTHKINGLDHHFLIFVPRNYDPAKRYPVRWDLHGGMGQPEWKKADGSWSGWGRITSEEYRSGIITVVPAGWWGSMWWEASQVDSFRAIMNYIKDNWNIHENRVYMMGSSDGAIAEWFYAFREPDPWAFYIGYVGFPARLTNTYLRADGQMHLSNLTDQKFQLINGVKDRIVNIDVTRKYIELFRGLDVEIDYTEHKDQGHNLTLSNEEVEMAENWLRTMRRDPLPEKLTWATERTDRYNRHLWLNIEELKANHPIDESNILPRIYGPNVDRSSPFPYKPWGRVELERKGNTVYTQTVGVRKFRLLLSPEEFDFEKPIRIVVDGEEKVDKVFEKSIETLRKWHAKDRDRYMLFAAEVLIDLEQ